MFDFSFHECSQHQLIGLDQIRHLIIRHLIKARTGQGTEPVGNR